MNRIALSLAASAILATTATFAYANGGGWFGFGDGHRGGHGGHERMWGGPGEGGPGPEGPRGPGAELKKMFDEFDTDKDGKLTQTEIDAGQAARFAKANSDNTGGVTLKEFEPFFANEHAERAVRAFQHLDKDGNGEVTSEEFAGRTSHIVADLDQDGDNALSKADRPAGGRGGPHGPMMGPDGDGPDGMGPDDMGPPPAP